jgi:peptide/nickel transport system substrate-binding protein
MTAAQGEDDMSRRRLVAAAAALALVGVAACSSNAASTADRASSGTISTLTVGTSLSVPSLSPLNPTTLASPIDDLSLESLFNLGPDNKLEPNLATSVSQPNPVTYVYHLRQGVKFWDGSELTSADVVYCWNLYRAPSSPMTANFVSVESIKAAGPYTVVVTLSKPNASWPYTPPVSPIFEMKFYQQHASTFGNAGTGIMGTGPWVLDSFDPTKGAELSANPHWWGGKVPIRHISVSIFSDETSLELAMRAGEVELAPYILDTQSFARTSGASMLSAPSFLAAYFSMDTQVAPWNDVHVRQAVAYALNRSAIVAATGGSNSPLYTFIPSSTLGQIASTSQVNGLLNSVPLYKYSLKQARAQMAESAYPHGFSTTLYEYNFGPSVAVSEVVAAELQKIGINAHIQVTPTLSAWYAGLASSLKDHSASFSTGWCSGSPDISACTTMALSPQGLDLADWDPPAVTSLMNVGLASSSAAQRFAAYSTVLKDVQAAVPYVALYQEGVGTAISSQITAPEFKADPNVFAVFNGSGAYALYVKPAS